MNLSPIAGIVLPTALTPTEPAPPATVDADHGVAVEFAALLAGLLGTPVKAPTAINPTPAPTDIPEGTEAEASADDAVDSEGAQVAEGESTAAQPGVPMVLSGMPAEARQPLADDSGAAADEAPLPAMTAVEGADAVAVPVPAQPIASPQQQVAGDATTEEPQAGRVPQNAAARVVPVPTRVDTVLLGADMVTEPIAPDPEPMTGITGTATASTAVTDAVEQSEPMRAAPETLADVVTRVADAVVTTVRRLLGRDAEPAASIEATPAEGEPAAQESEAPAQTTVRVVARGAAHAATNGGGESLDDTAGDHEAPVRDVAAEAARRTPAQPVLSDATPIVAAASGGSTPLASGSPSASGSVVGGAAVPPDPAPAPETPQLVTVRFEGPGGVESRIRVSVRGDTVHATILTDALSAPQLELSLPELQRSLADRGFSESRVSVRVLAGLEAAMATTARQETAAGDGARHRDAQDRHAPEWEFAEDDRGRGRRNHQGEEAHS